ncbi:MAG: hypothetical protein P8L44_18555 [Opitutales bacterium]|jgi:hypothetical protein|nr:hypothetical protein [Opitutales bacterium]
MSKKEDIQKHPGYKRWVFVFVVVAVIVHAGVFYLFNWDLKEPAKRVQDESFVVFQPEGYPMETDELEQQAYLFDSEPIFLPTDRNYSGPIKTDASVWEPEVQLAASFPADIRWDDSLLLLDSELNPGAGTALDLLLPVSRDFVSEFATQTRAKIDKQRPGLYVEAKTSFGKPVLNTFIEFDTEQTVEFPLNPAEFSISITDYGLAGNPLLVSPSGSEITDDFVRDFILERVHPLLVGTTGYFHIRIGL